MTFDISKLKHLPKILDETELKFFNGLSAVFVLSFFMLIISVFLGFTTKIPQNGGRYTEGVIGRPRLINPLYADNNATDRDLVKLLYAGLIKFNGTELVPDLAREWQVSPDQKIYTFTLRENIKWPDGKAFNAHDVVFTIETIKNPRYQSPLLSTFTGIEIEAVDDLTVKFTLPKPLTPFLESLSVGILPGHIWSQIPLEAINLTDFNTQPFGLGPYKFKKLVKDKFGTIRSYTIEKNNDYHLSKARIKTITFRFYENIEEAITGLDQNEVEGLGFLPPGLLNETKIKPSDLRSFQLPQYTAIFFNTSANSKVATLEIRNALALAIDKDTILAEAIEGQGQIIHGPILPGYPGYNESIEKFNFDLNKAAQILENNGWTLGDDSLRHDKDGNILEIPLVTADTPELIKAAEIIKQSWNQLGIQVSLNIIATSAIQSTIISPRKFDVLLFGEIVGLDPDPYPFWHSSQISTQGLNLSNFKHKEADQVLEEARSTASVQKKAEKYIHFQNILVAEIPAIFLYNPNYLYPVPNKIKGINQQRIINPSDRFANVNNWYIKTKRKFGKD